MGRSGGFRRVPHSSSEGSAIIFVSFLFRPNFGHTKNRLSWPNSRFSVAPASIFDDFGSQNWSPQLIFSVFFQNGDFVKIVLPLWWEHSFQGLDHPKIDLEIDCARQRRTTSRKIASDAVSERAFSVPGSFFVDFTVPLGSQGSLFGPTFGQLSPTFVTFS